jgi:hypothetical protein
MPTLEIGCASAERAAEVVDTLLREASTHARTSATSTAGDTLGAID